MANPFETIGENYRKSQLGKAIASIPTDTRTPQEKIRAMVDENPNTPKLATESPVMLTGPEAQGPSPASIPMDAPINPQLGTVQAKNWNLPQASQPSANPYSVGFQQAGQIANMMPSGGLNLQAGAAKEIGQAQSTGFAEQSVAQQEHEKSLKESQDRQKQIQLEKEAAQKEFDTKYDEALADLKGTQIDSERLWKNKSTGSKILTGIGLALSAFGGPEAVARSNQIIQSAIDKDIEEQKANYGVKKEGLQGMSNVYARMMDKFGDKEKAEAATRSFYNDLTQNKLSQITASTNSKVALANADMLKGQFQSQKDQLVSQMGLALGQAAASKPLEYDQVISDKYTPKSDEEAKRYIPGIGLATDAESAKEIRTGVTNFNDFNGTLNKLVALREKYGSETLPSEAKSLMTQLRGQLKFAVKNIEKLGVLSESDTGMIDDVVADGSSFNPNTLARLKALQGSSLAKFSNSIKPRLMNPTQSLATKLKTGQF